jgi:D-tagatose 6-phosphate 4-epimerase
MIAAYAAAGFPKLRLDTFMGCQGEPIAFPDALTAAPAAGLARIAEEHQTGHCAPVCVIGAEVPIPGDAHDALYTGHVAVTTPEAVAETYRVHQEAFAAAPLAETFGRVIALVVQPGGEFGHSDVIQFGPQ